MKTLTDEARVRLRDEKNAWVGTVRPDGRPHLAPVWFVFVGEKFYFSTEGKSVKAANIAANPQVVMALEDGSHPVICEGTARAMRSPAPDEVAAEFERKYEWKLTTEEQYSQLFDVTPVKWLIW